MTFDWVRIAVVGAVLAALGGALMWFGESRYDAGQAEVQGRWDKANAVSAATAASAAADERAKEQDRAKAQRENANETLRLAQLARTLRAALDARNAAERDGLLDAAAAVAARGGAGSTDPAAAAQCKAATDALRDVLGKVSAEYLSLARDADEELDDARRRGGECARDYDSLITTTPPRKD